MEQDTTIIKRNSPGESRQSGPAQDSTTGRAPAAPQKRVRVLLADDHPVVRKGLISYLERQPHLELVGEASDGQEALRKAKELLPDVILMDMDMPRLNGLLVTEALRQEVPNIKVLIVSADASPEFMLRVIQSGARGHVLKDSTPQALVEAIGQVEGGQAAFGPGFARVALSQMAGVPTEGPDVSKLTRREREVLAEIAKGFSNKEIGCRLHIGTRTVETHRENLMAKLGIHNVAGLTKFAFAQRLVTMRE
jgi:DNA-binding NarL/FixJ family response regulator